MVAVKCVLERALKVAIALVLAAALVPNGGEAFAAERPSQAQGRAYMGFSDVSEGDWYANDDMLGYAVDNGLLKGYDNGMFGPDDTLTRAQVATILWRIAGMPAADAEDFSDVDYSLWYGEAIEWARCSGVVSGYGDTNQFDPDGDVTREQFAVMLSNYAGEVAGLDVSSDCGALGAISGAEGVSSWAREQMGWAVDRGIISGVDAPGGVRVDPQGSALRCQVAKMASVFHRDVLPPRIDEDHENVVDYVDEAVVAESVDYEVVGDARIRASADSLPCDVDEGDVVVLKPTQGNPEGAAIEVGSMVEQGDDVVLYGEAPDLVDVVERLDVEGFTLSEGIEATPAEGVEMVRDGASARDATDMGTFEFNYKGVAIKLSPSAEFKVEYGFFNVQEAYVALNLDEEVTGRLVGGSANIVDEKLADLSLPTNIPGLFLNVSLWVEVSATSEVTLTWSCERALGARYKDGEFSSLFKDDRDVSIDMDGSVRAGVDGAVSLDVCRMPVVDASLGGGAEFTADEVNVRDNGMVCLDLTSSLYVDVGIGQHESLMHDLGLSWSMDLANCKVGSLHLEDMMPVVECTWAESAEEEPESPGGQPSQPVDPDEPSDQPSDPSEGAPCEFPPDIVDYRFVYSSGAGAWDTSLWFGADGAFSGRWLDDDADCRYLSYYEGKFTEPRMVSGTELRFRFERMTNTTDPGLDHDGGKRVHPVLGDVYGLGAETSVPAGDFTLYLPGQRMSDIPERVTIYLGSWAKETELLDRYVLVNNADPDWGTTVFIARPM